MTETQLSPEYVRMPVSVLMTKHARNTGAWTTYEWLTDSVVLDAADSTGKGVTGRPLHEDDESTYIWQGLSLEFFKDGGESYWYNLISEAPRLFIMVEVDETDSTQLPYPSLVTASQDEAVAHMETDGMVHSVPMPLVVIENLERFVVDHYIPFQKKKRKRKEWRENSDFEKRKR